MVTTQTLIEIGSREYGVIHAEIIEVSQSEPTYPCIIELNSNSLSCQPAGTPGWGVGYFVRLIGMVELLILMKNKGRNTTFSSFLLRYRGRGGGGGGGGGGTLSGFQ